jgi:hypothetical protein
MLAVPVGYGRWVTLELAGSDTTISLQHYGQNSLW